MKSARRQLLDTMVESIQNGSGSLAQFQKRMKDKLKKDDADILNDPEAIYIIGRCAEHDWFKHTADWRRHLKRYGFDFQKVTQTRQCPHQGAGHCYHCGCPRGKTYTRDLHKSSFQGDELDNMVL